MPTFDTFISRHGESLALFIIEEIERVEGILYRDAAPLEDRWNVLMGSGKGYDDAPAVVSLVA